MENQLHSKLLEEAVDEFAKLPGIGKKNALRLSLHLLQRSEEEVKQFTDTLMNMYREIKKCEKCKNISDTQICNICDDPNRAGHTICVVENIQDVIALERTGQYQGVYHVLGGLISPIDGISPDDLEIGSLIYRLKNEDIQEIILAFSTTSEGDTTAFFLFRKLKDFDVRITTPAKGVSMGGELEYNDVITLGNSIKNRIEFQ